jgi:hypothetical protein
VFLAYLDDGGKDGVKIFGGIVLHEHNFKPLELFSAFAAMRLLSPEREFQFEEFHASDLYNGSPPFDVIDEQTRHNALLDLVTVPNSLGLTYVYSAVDMKALSRGPVRSASWIDTAFSMCACAVDDAASGQVSIMILDEPSNAKEKGGQFATVSARCAKPSLTKCGRLGQTPTRFQRAGSLPPLTTCSLVVQPIQSACRLLTRATG